MIDVEAKSCFIDTNVWLYALIQAQDHDKTAIAKLTIQNNEVVISTQVVNEVCVNLIKKARLHEVNIRDLIESFYNNYHVVMISQTILLEASRLRDRYRFSYWDSLIVACALAEGTSIVYSEDMDSGMIVESRLQIINPFAGQGAT